MEPSAWPNLANIDPEMERHLEKIGPQPSMDTSITNVPIIRAAMAEATIEIPVRDGSLTQALIYKPAPGFSSNSAPLAVLYHGGGMVLGLPEQEEQNCLTLVRNHGCVAVSVTYRLAPEHPFPVPIEGFWDALNWTTANASTFGANPSKGFILGGTSAGAHICMVLSHLARDEKLAPPLTGLFFSLPSVLPPEIVPDRYRTEYRSYEQMQNAPVEDPKAMLELKSYYKGDSSSPLYAPLNWPGGHGGLPPTYIQVCGMDPFRDEGLLYERVMRTEYGVKTRLNVYPGLPHVFWALFPQLAASKDVLEDTVKGLAWLMDQSREE